MSFRTPNSGIQVPKTNGVAVGKRAHSSVRALTNTRLNERAGVRPVITTRSSTLHTTTGQATRTAEQMRRSFSNLRLSHPRTVRQFRRSARRGGRPKSDKYWSSPLPHEKKLNRSLVNGEPIRDHAQTIEKHKPLCVRNTALMEVLLDRDFKPRRYRPRVSKSKVLDAQLKGNKRVDIMSLLKHEKLGAIKGCFVENDGELDLDEFVDVMSRYLQVEGVPRENLAYSLCRFFADVDVNGDGSMEWDEFTNFIVDQGMASSDGSVAGEDGGGEGSGGGSMEYVNNPHVYSRICMGSRQTCPIERMRYIPELGHVLTITRHHPYIHVLDARTLDRLHTLYPPTTSGPHSRVGLTHNNSSEESPFGNILDATYVAGLNMVAASSTDRMMRFWDPADDYSCLPLEIRCDDAQTILTYSQTSDMLFSAADSPTFRGWRVRARSSDSQPTTGGRGLYSCELVNEYAGHKEPPLDLLLLGNMNVMASGSLDKSVILWDTNTQRIRHTLQGHKKGVFALSYNSLYHCLMSAGFEHAPMIWNPFCGKVICRLPEHYAPLIGVASVPDTPQLVTADRSGVVKIWDLRSYGCVQSIHVENHRENRLSELSCVLALPGRRVLAGSVNVYTIDSTNSESHHTPQLADQTRVVDCRYNANFGHFVTLGSMSNVGLLAAKHGAAQGGGGSCRIWDGRVGCIERVYKSITKFEATALCLDAPQKKFIVGDAQGWVYVFNHLNGALMKSQHVAVMEARGNKASKHKRDVSSLVSSAGQQQDRPGENGESGGAAPSAVLLRIRENARRRSSGASSNSLTRSTSSSARRRHGTSGKSGETDGGEEPVRVCHEIVALDYIGEHGMIIAADSGGYVTFLDETQSNAKAGIPKLKQLPAVSDKVTCSAVSESLSLYACASVTGEIALFEYQALAACGVLKGIQCEVTAMCFLDPYPVLVTGDTSGSICLWVVRPLTLAGRKCVLRFVHKITPRPPAGAPANRHEKSLPVKATPTGLAFWSFKAPDDSGGSNAGGSAAPAATAVELESPLSKARSDTAENKAPQVVHTRQKSSMIANPMAAGQGSAEAREASRREAERLEKEEMLCRETISFEAFGVLGDAPQQSEGPATDGHGDGASTDELQSQATVGSSVYDSIMARRQQPAEHEAVAPESKGSDGGASSTSDELIPPNNPVVSGRQPSFYTVGGGGGGVFLTELRKEEVNASPQHLWLYVSDSLGHVTVYDLSLVIMRWSMKPYAPSQAVERRLRRMYGSSYVPPSSLAQDSNEESEAEEEGAAGMDYATSGATIGDNRRTLRKEYLEAYRRVHLSMCVKMEQAARRCVQTIRPGDLKLINCWRAHTDSITRVHMIYDPPPHTINGVITVSIDRTARVWDKHGQQYGQLEQGRQLDTELPRFLKREKVLRAKDAGSDVPEWFLDMDLGEESKDAPTANVGSTVSAGTAKPSTGQRAGSVPTSGAGPQRPAAMPLGGPRSEWRFRGNRAYQEDKFQRLAEAVLRRLDELDEVTDRE